MQNVLRPLCVTAERFCRPWGRRQGVVILAISALATSSSAFATTVNITGQNGYTQYGDGNTGPGDTPPSVTAPINVSNAESFGGDGASTNGSLVFGPENNQYTGFGNITTNGSFLPVTSGIATISAEVLLPVLPAPGAESFAFSADDGPNPDVAPNYFATFFEAYSGDNNGFEPLVTTIDLDDTADSVPYTTTLNGVTIDSGTYVTDPGSPISVNEVDLYLGQGVNGTPITADFYVDDLSVTDTIGSVTTPVFFDNFDEYVTASTGVPEPASLSLLAVGGTSLLMRRRRGA